MRVMAHGIMERVQIESIMVYREHEELDVRQDWIEDEDVHTENYVVEADKIMYCRPTSFALEDVTPVLLKVGIKPEAGQSADDVKWTQLCAAAKRVLAMDEAAFQHAIEGIPLRYMLMVAMDEISEESGPHICKRLGYRSQTPLLSARSKVKWDKDWLRNVRRIIDASGYRPTGRPGSIL